MSVKVSGILRLSVVTAMLVVGVPAHAEPAFGMFPVVYEGIHMPSPQEPQNSSGPFVFRAIDLDHGTELKKDGVETDFTLALDVIPLTFVPSGRSSGDVADAGATPVGLKQCQALLSTAVAHPPIAAQRAITNYYCLRTAQGRTGIFRIRLAGVRRMPQNFETVVVIIEYFVWNSSQPDAHMSSIRKGFNLDQGDLYSDGRPAYSPEQCSALCNETARCIAVTYVSSQEGSPGHCWLKDRLVAIGFSENMASALKSSRSQ